MPLDPNIPLSGRPATFNLGEMMSSFGNMQQMQMRRRQMDAYDLQARQRDQATRDDYAMRAAVQQHTGADGVVAWDDAIAALNSKGFVPAGMALQKHVTTQREERAKALSEETKATGAQFALTAQALQGVKDEASFKLAMGTISKFPAVAPLAAQFFGDGKYDAEKVKQAVAFGTTVKEHADIQNNALKLAQDAMKLGNDTEELRLNKVKAFTESAVLGFSTAKTPEAWDKVEGYIREFAGNLAPMVLQQFAPDWSPEAQAQAGQIGISPEKRAELAGQDAARKEAGRHNRAMEGVAHEGIKLRTEEIGLARKALAAKELNPAEIGPLADMAIKDPEILKQFTATERGKIMRFIATDKGGEFPNRRAQSLLEIAELARTTLTDLKSHPGLEDAVGYKGPLAAMFGPISGTDAAGFVAKFDTLKSRLTLPRLEMMRGLGAMSEKEFKALSDAASALSRDMGEKEFFKEIATIETTLNTVESRLRSQINTGGAGVGGLTVAPGGGIPGAGGAQTLIAPDGTPRLVPADKVDEFLRRGGRRQ